MNIIINSRFRPFSYDELIKPMLQYKEAYDKAEADYSTLATQTEQWKDVANQTQSPEAYAMYNKYANDLNNVIDDFSKGMTFQNRSQLLNMKRRYASDIIPIAKADAALKEANDLRIKAGPDAIFEVGEYNSLDSFLHGKRANNRYQSRDAITKRTAAMTEAAMASAMKDPEFQKAMGDQYWMLTQHTGGSYEDLKAAIANNAQAQNRFAEIKAQVMKDAGYDRYDASGKQAIEDAINTGLYAGLDKPTRSFQANQAYLNPLQSEQLQEAKTEFQWKKDDRKPIPIGNNKYIDPVNGLTFTQDTKGNRTYDTTYKKDPNGNNKTGKRNSGKDEQENSEYTNRLSNPVKVKVGGGSNVEAYGDDVDPTGAEKWNSTVATEDKEIGPTIKKYIGDDDPEGYDIYVENPGIVHSHKRVLIIPRTQTKSKKVGNTSNNDINEDAY